MALITEMTGVVLAGGASRRMGRDKAWLDVGGCPLILHQLDRLARVFSDVRISAKEPETFASLPFPVVPDGTDVSAPIMGIVASLRELGRPIFVLAIDLPEFPETLVQRLSRRLLDEDAACVVPRAGGKIQGLCGAYRPSVLEAFDRNAASGRLSIFDLVKECGGLIEEEESWRTWVDPSAFENWNTPEDVNTASTR